MLALLTAAIKELGWTGTLVHSINRLAAKLGMRQACLVKYLITRQEVVALGEQTLGRVRGIEVRELLCDDPLCQQLGRPNEVIQARFAQGGHCYAAFRKGELAGFMWLNFGQYQEDEVRCTFILSPAEESAWDYDVFVFPQHRLSFTFLRLWEHANEAMAVRGVKTCYSRIAYYNVASLASHGKLGSHVIGSVYFLRLGRMQLSWSLNFRPHIAFSADAGAFPQLLIP